jgi:hypothetical protein
MNLLLPQKFSCVLGRYVVSGLLCILASRIEAKPQTESPHNALLQAKGVFLQGNCKKVVQLLGGMDFYRGFEDEAQFIERYRMLGVCYFRIGQKNKAEEELTHLLFIQPDYELDQFATPPAVIELFERLKENVKAKSMELERQKEHAVDKPKIIEKETIYRRTSMVPAFIPFGVGQFENNQITKGALIASAEVVTLGANISFYWWKRASGEGTYNLAQTLQFVAIGAFGALYIYGVIDALLNRDELIKESVVINPSHQATEEFLRQLDRAKQKPE